MEINLSVFGIVAKEPFNRAVDDETKNARRRLINMVLMGPFFHSKQYCQDKYENSWVKLRRLAINPISENRPMFSAYPQVHDTARILSHVSETNLEGRK